MKDNTNLSQFLLLNSKEEVSNFLKNHPDLDLSHNKFIAFSINSFHKPMLDYMLEHIPGNYLKFDNYAKNHGISEKTESSLKYLIEQKYLSKKSIHNFYTKAIFYNNKKISLLIKDTCSDLLNDFKISNSYLFEDLDDKQVQQILSSLNNSNIFYLKDLTFACNYKSALIFDNIIRHHSLSDINQQIQNNTHGRIDNIFSYLVENSSLEIRSHKTYQIHEKTFRIEMLQSVLKNISHESELSKKEKRVIESILSQAYFSLDLITPELKRIEYSISSDVITDFLKNKSAYGKNLSALLSLCKNKLDEPDFVNELYHSTLHIFNKDALYYFQKENLKYSQQDSNNFYDAFFKRIYNAQYRLMKENTRNNYFSYISQALNQFVDNGFSNEDSPYLMDNMSKFHKKEHLASVIIFLEKNQLQRMTDVTSKNTPNRL